MGILHANRSILLLAIRHTVHVYWLMLWEDNLCCYLTRFLGPRSVFSRRWIQA